jgi:hypothetical protein
MVAKDPFDMLDNKNLEPAQPKKIVKDVSEKSAETNKKSTPRKKKASTTVKKRRKRKTKTTKQVKK